MPINFLKFRKSLRFAWNGLRIALRENNFRIQLGAALFTTLAGIFFRITHIEWICILFSICGVLVAELFNTALEKLCDHLHPQQHPAIGAVKDLSAAAVLIAAGTALVVGVVIFTKYVLYLIPE